MKRGFSFSTLQIGTGWAAKIVGKYLENRIKVREAVVNKVLEADGAPANYTTSSTLVKRK